MTSPKIHASADAQSPSEQVATVRKAVSFDPDGSFKVGGNPTTESVQAYASKIQRVTSGATQSPAIAGKVAVATPIRRHGESDEWHHIASTDVVSDEEREFVASLLRQIDENNRDISLLSARARETDKLREQLTELQTRLDDREQTVARLTGVPCRVESPQVQTLNQQLLVRDRELTQLKSRLAALQQEHSSVDLQLRERNQRVVELEARLEAYVTGDDQGDKSSPARSFASGAVANAAARAAATSTDPKPHPGTIRQLYQPPEDCDDLKLIKGIGLKMEQLLYQLGVTTFRQLAGFEQKDIEDVSAELKAFPGRIQRDNWVGQAVKLQQQYYGDNVSA